MKKIFYILFLFCKWTWAQNSTECPFEAKKYVPYDDKFDSSSYYIPTQYIPLLQNNNNYNRNSNLLTTSVTATCFYKTSVHNNDSIKKPFVFVEGISFDKPAANEHSYEYGEYFRQGWYPNHSKSEAVLRFPLI